MDVESVPAKSLSIVRRTKGARADSRESGNVNALDGPKVGAGHYLTFLRRTQVLCSSLRQTVINQFLPFVE
jgi:hypothetical protein